MKAPKTIVFSSAQCALPFSDREQLFAKITPDSFFKIGYRHLQGLHSGARIDSQVSPARFQNRQRKNDSIDHNDRFKRLAF